MHAILLSTAPVKTSHLAGQAFGVAAKALTSHISLPEFGSQLWIPTPKFQAVQILGGNGWLLK